MAPKRKNVGVEEKRVEARERDDEEEIEDEEEEEHTFSRNYFLAKEVGSSTGKRYAARKAREINLVDEQVMTAIAEILWEHYKYKAKKHLLGSSSTSSFQVVPNL